MGNASRKRRNVETAIAVCLGGLGARCRSGEIGSNARCAGSRVVAPLTAELVVACIRGGVRCISSAARCAGCMIGLQPIQDRLPLREVGLNLRGRQIEN